MKLLYNLFAVKNNIAILGIGLCSLYVNAGETSNLINAQFARDMFASRASVLILGDSTNNPRGNPNFGPYYEGFIEALPDEIDLCGFRMSGSTGNTGLNQYLKLLVGSTS